ncbi:MAG: hypothetical protein FI703_03510 [SAR202 cluster bacterium]|nr:hypothetical protein [SAR202 cluster bacterium]
MQTQPLGRRIAIFGGGGKTSLADALARKLGIRHISLDSIQHGPTTASLHFLDLGKEYQAYVTWCNGVKE